MMTDMETAMIRALAAIDDALGMPQDGCNNTAATLEAIALLHAVHRDDAAEIERNRAAIAELLATLKACESALRLVERETGKSYAATINASTTIAKTAPRFANVFCSQCGQEFGPGDHGFSHCANHKGLVALDD